MKFLKVVGTFVLALALVGCAGNDTKKEETKKQEPISMVTPMGATALSLVNLYGEDHVTIDTVDGSETLAAEFSKKDGYDVIVAPINLGSKLISNGKSEYVLDSVVTWGNLYIVATDENALRSEGTFAAFGEAAVPQKVLTSSFDMESITPTITYFNSVNDVQAQLLTGKANVGMLAEPAATATIAKAKEQGMELNVIKDLQTEYQASKESRSKGYPQAALFVKEGSKEAVSSALASAKKFVNNDAKDASRLRTAVEKATIEKLGVPSVDIVVKTWSRQNISFVKANTVKDDIKTFLLQFDITLKDSNYTK